MVGYGCHRQRQRKLRFPQPLRGEVEGIEVSFCADGDIHNPPLWPGTARRVRPHSDPRRVFVYRVTMFQMGLPPREPGPTLKPRPLEQPTSGYHRIAIGEPCELRIGDTRHAGLVWNLSVVGVYVVLAPPLPAA